MVSTGSVNKTNATTWLNMHHTRPNVDKKLSVEKVKEEIAELIDSIEKNSNKIHEAADVLYHLMVLLEANAIKIEDVMDELKKRQK